MGESPPKWSHIHYAPKSTLPITHRFHTLYTFRFLETQYQSKKKWPDIFSLDWFCTRTIWVSHAAHALTIAYGTKTRTLLCSNQNWHTQHFLYSSLSILTKYTLHIRRVRLRTTYWICCLFFCFFFARFLQENSFSSLPLDIFDNLTSVEFLWVITSV